MALINSSIRSFAGLNSSNRSFSGLRSSMAERKSGKTTRIWLGDKNKDSSNDEKTGNTYGFGGVDDGNRNATPQKKSGGRPGVGDSGWWLCTSSDFGLSPISWLHIENASIRKPRRFIKHPIESGAVIIDHIVRDPWTAQVKGIVEDSHYNGSGFGTVEDSIGEVEKDLKAAYDNWNIDNYLGFKLGKNGSVIIDDRGRPVNFQLVDYTSRISKERIGVYEYDIHLQEIMTTFGEVEEVESPEDADTKGK